MILTLNQGGQFIQEVIIHLWNLTITKGRLSTANDGLEHCIETGVFVVGLVVYSDERHVLSMASIRLFIQKIT